MGKVIQGLGLAAVLALGGVAWRIIVIRQTEESMQQMVLAASQQQQAFLEQQQQQFYIIYIMRNYGCGATLPVLAIFLIRTGALARLP